jgi:glycosyltransferase involved in cell wall biosynthesis
MLHDRYAIRGGEDESTDAEVAILRQNNHDVDLWDVTNKSISDAGVMKTGLNAIWSRDMYWHMREKCRTGSYDLVHIQNFFPLFSPSVHHACAAEKTPVVQALRNYRLFCLNGIFFRDGHVCEDCTFWSFPWPGIIHKCYRESLPGSVVVASMLGTHRTLRTWQDKVSCFYTLSGFAKEKFVEAGFASEDVFVKPNFVFPDPGVASEKQNFIFFAGRLSPEKGISFLLKTWQQFNLTTPLKIAGDGPMLSEVISASQSSPNIEYVGRLSLDQTYDYLGKARFALFPTEWFETFGRIVIEAFAKGTPVLASDIGAGASLIDDGKNGLKYKTGDMDDFVQKLLWMWNNAEQTTIMGKNARREYEEKYTPEKNYEMLMSIYQTAMERNRLRVGNG